MLSADLRNELTYTMNEELRARPSELPSGVQRQAFQLALQRLAIPYLQKKAKLASKEAGLTLSPFEGLHPKWQKSLQNLMNFMDGAFQKLDMRAAALATHAARDALQQGTASEKWNSWSQQALQNYLNAVHAFGVMVTLATRATPVPPKVPPAFVALAKSAGMPPPVFAPAGELGELDEITPGGLFAVLVTAGVAGLGWWFAKKQVGA